MIRQPVSHPACSVIHLSHLLFSILALVYESNREYNTLTNKKPNEFGTILVYPFQTSYSKLNNQARLPVSELHHAWITQPAHRPHQRQDRPI